MLTAHNDVGTASDVDSIDKPIPQIPQMVTEYLTKYEEKWGADIAAREGTSARRSVTGVLRPTPLRAFNQMVYLLMRHRVSSHNGLLASLNVLRIALKTTSLAPQGEKPSKDDIRLLWLVCLAIATKTLEDRPYDNKSFARIGFDGEHRAYDLARFNDLERRILMKTDFNVNTKPEDIGRILHRLGLEGQMAA